MDKVGKEGGTNVLHHTNSLLSLANKVILSLLNLQLRLLRRLSLLMMLVLLLARQLEQSTLRPRLRSIQHQSRVLDTLSRTSSEHQVGVQCGVPASQESALDLCILCQSRLADTLGCKCVLLQCGCERVLAGARVLLLQEMGGGEGGARDGVGEGLWLWLGGWWCDERGLCFGWSAGGGEELDLLADAAAKVGQVLTDVVVVVALVGVLVARGGLLAYVRCL